MCTRQIQFPVVQIVNVNLKKCRRKAVMNKQLSDVFVTKAHGHSVATAWVNEMEKCNEARMQQQQKDLCCTQPTLHWQKWESAHLGSKATPFSKPKLSFSESYPLVKSSWDFKVAADDKCPDRQAGLDGSMMWKAGEMYIKTQALWSPSSIINWIFLSLLHGQWAKSCSMSSFFLSHTYL